MLSLEQLFDAKEVASVELSRLKVIEKKGVLDPEVLYHQGAIDTINTLIHVALVTQQKESK